MPHIKRKMAISNTRARIAARENPTAPDKLVDAKTKTRSKKKGCAK